MFKLIKYLITFLALSVHLYAQANTATAIDSLSNPQHQTEPAQTNDIETPATVSENEVIADKKQEGENEGEREEEREEEILDKKTTATRLFTEYLSLDTSLESEQESEQAQTTVVDQVRTLIYSIADRREAIRSLENKLKEANIEVDVERLTIEKLQQEEKLAAQAHSLEQLATGAVDSSLFDPSEKEKFSWQAELEEVFKPLLFELKRLTEKPRQIEHLRSQKNSFTNQIETAEHAIKETDELIEALADPELTKPLQDLRDKWQLQLDDIGDQLQLITFQLNEKLASRESRGAAFVTAVKEFFTGRGANMILAIMAFCATFVTLRFLESWVDRSMSNSEDRERRFHARLVHIIFQVVTVLLSLFAMMATLYAVSDWLLLTLLIILLIGLLFAVRNSLPRYFDEVRILLNLGPVREGERVIYNGLPWKVSRLNIYSQLANPRLTGGELNLPLGEILNLVSRRYSPKEPWFPSKTGDYVIMSDDNYGRIQLQTPEIVQMVLFDGTKITYSTADYLAAQPRNLSEGFILYTTFGLDYEMQPSITTDTLRAFETSLTETLKQSRFNEWMLALRVEFEEAGASSLNLVAISTFSGDAGKEYNALRRFLQHAAVNACNQHKWSIPFNQLTVHMSTPADKAG